MIGHVSLKCDDSSLVKEAVRFYHDLFGMRILVSWPEGVYLDGGIEIFTNGSGKREKGAVRHFALEAEDVDSVVESAEAKGYRILIRPKDIEYPFKARIAFVEGVLGEEIEVLTKKE